MMKDIIFPQAIRSILPGLVNEGISLLKESSILSYIGAVELLRAADQITVLTFRFFEPYLVIALIYYVMVMILTVFANRLERWLNRSDRVS
jgi:ABC-type amino acid transport system permease subunit